MTGSVRGSEPSPRGALPEKGDRGRRSLRGAQDAVVWNGPLRSTMASGRFRITSSKAPSFQMRVTVSSARPRAFGTRPLSESSSRASDGKTFRILTVIDEHTRECLGPWL